MENRRNKNRTTRIADIYEGEPSSYPSGFTVLGDYMYFKASDEENGYELWRTAGSGASLVKDIFNGDDSGYPSNFHVMMNYSFLQGTTMEMNCG